MIKKLLLRCVVYPLAGLVSVLALIVFIAWQQELASEDDLEYLWELSETEGWLAVLYVVKVELTGHDTENAADPGYDRFDVAGRGHSPWVLRGNLDGRPRMLQFALAPELWAAYDTEQASLYQLWQGEVLFEGSVYNYRHGPQPTSQGSWYLRHETPAQWFLEDAGERLPATVHYLGHRFGEGYRNAALHYAINAGEQRVELLEYPDIVERDGQRYFSRRFEQLSGDVVAGFTLDNGESLLARDTLEFPLTDATSMEAFEGVGRGRDAEDSELERGLAVIQNSDCLGCHAENHRVTGPAWSEVAKRFRGTLQEPVIESLVESVLEGGSGNWGKIPMPPHPRMSEAEARDAVAYILSVEEAEEELNPPLDANGRAYASTREYDIRPRLDSLHPSFSLEDLAPEGFEPKVGGLSFREDGKFVVVSWDQDGGVYLVDPAAPSQERVQRIAEGLHEPLGVTHVDGRLFVLQKQELTELVDTNGDEIIDHYRAFSHDWPANPNFHSFSFGLEYRDGYFYILQSICVLPGGASCPEQMPSQGKLLRVAESGQTEVVASGFRTPNGIAEGPGGAFYVTDNEGDWLPSSKLVEIREGAFYGSHAVPADNSGDLQETLPVVWLPQDEVGNSPTQPLLLEEGPYAGQMIHGDIYNGGVKRVFMEEVGGQRQGAVFRFSAGFKGGVNRLVRGPDGAIYVGEIGNPPNWGEFGKPWYGLERLKFEENRAFEMLAVRARHDGFEIELTRPLAEGIELMRTDLAARQWFYHPTEQYGGPKYDPTELFVAGLELSDDRRRIRARLHGLRAGYVVYLRLHERLRGDNDAEWWAGEAWYTLNQLPAADDEATVPMDSWVYLFDGESLDGWRNYGGEGQPIEKWAVQDGALTLAQPDSFSMWQMISSWLFGGPSGDLIYYREKFQDFELSLEWKIAEGGNSGIFYFVKDEEANAPWLTGLEMQVLDNDGHKDGAIPSHRAGALYDLITPPEGAVRQVGEWNEVLIRVRDNHIEQWLNGTLMAQVERGSEEWERLVGESKFADMDEFGTASAGYIVLQDHGDPVWYRNIKVRPLSRH